MAIKKGEPMLAEDILRLNFLPVGTILMYDGSNWVNDTTIPGWYKCDGQNGTPNLVDKFLRGAAAAGETGGADSGSVKLTSAHIPAHTHGLAAGSATVSGTIGDAAGHTHTVSNTVGTVGGHTHTVSGTAGSAGAHKHTYEKSFRVTPSDTDNYGGMNDLRYETTDTSTAGAHTHDVTGTAGTAGGHTHTVSSTVGTAGGHTHTFSGSSALSGNTGSYGTVDVSRTAVTIATVPGYYAVIYIKKMA
ncbi:MAG: hypothetical protein LBQ83_05280 [Candidatus Margulisbacteria bacterium]|jgi:hypothetical protein|nr:hypothetical protein [Candidatus Margulisiibacteriota bacterium]